MAVYSKQEEAPRNDSLTSVPFRCTEMKQAGGQIPRRSKVAGPLLAAGFGIGALEEAGEEDTDIYDQGDPSRKS